MDYIRNKISISEEVLNELRENVGMFPAETGGILGISKRSLKKEREEVIDLFCFDKWAKTSGSTFYYDVEKMTEVYRNWLEKGSSFAGVIHSHPYGITEPSFHDRSSALLHMDFLKSNVFYMPIVQAKSDGNYTVFFYTIIRDEEEKTLITSLEFIVKAEGDKKYKYFFNNTFRPIKDKIEEISAYRKSIASNNSEDNTMDIKIDGKDKKENKNNSILQEEITISEATKKFIYRRPMIYKEEYRCYCLIKPRIYYPPMY